MLEFFSYYQIILVVGGSMGMIFWTTFTSDNQLRPVVPWSGVMLSTTIIFNFNDKIFKDSDPEFGSS